MQPTIAIKNALQEGRPVPWSPKLLYRGLGVSCSCVRWYALLMPGLAVMGLCGTQVNLGSIAPITAIQVSDISFYVYRRAHDTSYPVAAHLLGAVW